MPYDVPGRADEVNVQLLREWNDTIAAAYDSQDESLKSRFFALDAERLRNPEQTDGIKWPGDPAEPSFCIDDQTAQVLSDWGREGRHALQNEYCEYAVVSRRDATGALRPKRVQVTTELREYWSFVAVRDPDRVRAMAAEVLGREPEWTELFGVPDPHTLTEDEREVAFGHTVAGHGNDPRLEGAGVPAQPTGALNTENALFMTHPINGLDDLLYIVLFGAKPYAVREDGELRRASRDEIFAAFEAEYLACRHADPAAALGAHGAALPASRWRSPTRWGCTCESRIWRSSNTRAPRFRPNGFASGAARRGCTSGSSSVRPTTTTPFSTRSPSRSEPKRARCWAAISCCANWRLVP